MVGLTGVDCVTIGTVQVFSDQTVIVGFVTMAIVAAGIGVLANWLTRARIGGV